MKLVVEQGYIYPWYMYYRAVHFKPCYELDFIPCWSSRRAWYPWLRWRASVSFCLFHHRASSVGRQHCGWYPDHTTAPPLQNHTPDGGKNRGEEKREWVEGVESGEIGKRRKRRERKRGVWEGREGEREGGEKWQRRREGGRKGEGGREAPERLCIHWLLEGWRWKP